MLILLAQEIKSQSSQLLFYAMTSQGDGDHFSPRITYLLSVNSKNFMEKRNVFTLST